MALTYEQFRQKLAALTPNHAEVEHLLREVFTEDGQVSWSSSGAPSTGGMAINPVAVTADYTAEAGDFVSVTASTVDITITLPTAVGADGKSIYIHKVDATAYSVLTSVKNLAYQNSTMHLVSNGADWIIS